MPSVCLYTFKTNFKCNSLKIEKNGITSPMMPKIKIWKSAVRIQMQHWFQVLILGISSNVMITSVSHFFDFQGITLLILQKKEKLDRNWKKSWTRAGNIFGRRSLGIDYPIIIMSRTVFSTFPKLTIHGSLYFFVFWAIMSHIEMWLWIMNLISLSVDINSKERFLPFFLFSIFPKTKIYIKVYKIWYIF